MSTFGSTIGSGGFRAYDANHEISYNYVEGVYGGNFQGPLLLDSGDAEGNSTQLDAHWRVVNARVERNVLVGNPEGIRFGHNYSLAPTGCTVQDNLVAQATTGTAITQRITPINTTLANNLYGSTPAAVSLVQGSDTIWRRANYGPRLTYLQSADVGVTGDAADTDGTGVLVGGSGTPADPTSAADVLGWGSPLPSSDEFTYTGAPNSSKWSIYNGPGHDGNGLRSPSRVTVDGSKMVLTGLAGSANSAGLAHKLDQQYGRWEIRCRSYYTSSPTTPGTLVGGYHPVLIVWPTSDAWPEDGEYDFLENGEPGMQAADAFLHYPSLDGANHQVDVADFPVDLRQFHNFAFEWSPNGLKGWVDGQAWFDHSGGAASDRKALQAMPSGHLTVQLDAFQATGCLASTFEIEWARVYTLTPSGSPAGPQTVSPVGISSREQFGLPAVTIPNAPAPANSIPSLLGSFILGTTTLGWTLTGPTPPPAGGQTVLAVGIPSGQALGVPAFDVPPGDQIVAPSGIAPATTFGRPTVSGGAPPAPAPGGVLVPALFAVGTDGITLTPLPAWVKMHLSPVRNSAGSLSIDYPSGAPGFDLLNSSVSANPLKALEIRVWLGGNNTAALGGWLVQKSGDSLTPGAIWTFSGHFHEWLLTKAIVAPQQISEANKSGALTFAGATAGLILATVMDQAKARGALPYVVRDFTTTTDSNGQPWSKAISSVKFAPKTTLGQIADKLVELGMVEYELSSNQLFRAYNPEGRGTDRSTGLDPVSFAQTFNLKERAHRESSRDAGTAVLVAGSEGFYSFASSPTAQAQLGWRAEVGADAGQLNSQAAVDAVAQNYLEKANSGTAEYAASIVVGPGHRLPLIDYGVGDWALVRVGTRYERQRIAQIELNFEPGTPPSGSVEFNDLITDKLTALYKRLNAISTGDAVVGTSESTPGGAGEDHIPPAAPRGLTVASDVAYQIPGESLTLAEVRAGWEAVTTNAYPDAATADKSTAADSIAARLGSGQTVSTTWTWSGAPATVTTYAPALLDEWRTAPTNSGDAGNELSPEALTWLRAYSASHVGGGAITDDVDHYVVQYQYLGLAGDALDGFWQSPDNSPTRQISITFGNIEGGRSLGVRVAAVDRSGNQGPWSDVVAVDTAADDVPPPAPSKPIASAWFRTMDITWDGKGSSGEDMIAAAPDILSGGMVEVHVDTGINFTPDRPLGANGKVDLALSRTFRAALYAAGTTNVTGLLIGTTYYARFVAVDRSGNASDPSETSDGVLPQQLVNIDIGPDAVGRLQIIDGEIVRAKIADAAINSLKVEEINVGLLRSGTMSANVVIGGRFETPIVNGNKVELDNAGIRLYQGSTVIGRWQVADASMLVTGTYISALSGERVNILPDGTFRLYPAAGVNYAQIANNEGAGTGPRVNFRGIVGTDGKTGHINLQPTGIGMFLGSPTALGPDDPTMGPNVSVGQPGLAAYRAGIHAFEIEERMGADASGNRVYWRVRNSSGVGRAGTVVHYGYRTVDDTPRFWGPAQNAGICFAQGEVFAIDNSGANFRPFRGSAFNFGSARNLKYDERPALLTDQDGTERNLLEVARHPNARSKRWKYHAPERPSRPTELEEPADWEFTERAPSDHIGPVADDLMLVAPDLVQVNPDDPADMTINVADLAGAAWEAVGVAGDELAALIQRVDELEDRFRSGHSEGSTCT